MRRRRSLLRALAVTACASAAALPAAAQDWQTMAQSRSAAGERALAVEIEYAAGELTLAPGAPGTLYRANLRYDADVFKPVMSYGNSRLQVSLDGSVKGRNLKAGSLDMRLSPDVPIDLDVQFGAAEATLNLGGMRIRNASIATGASSTRLNVASPNLATCERLQIQVGAAQFEAVGLANLNARRVTLEGGVGDMTLDFSGAWRSDVDVSVGMGLGSLTLRVPRHVGMSVRKGGLLSSFDSQGLVKRGNMYFSENWETARHKLTLEVDAAFGSISVVWIDT